jgi:argininosuccinate synthase
LGYEVYTALANTGGFSAEELKAVEERAYALGAKAHVNIDVTGDYYSKCIKYMVFGNVLRNKTYPISVSSERTFQALAIVNYANSIGADAIAHGSTGAGNDQVRFDLTFEVFAPQIEIITPTRDMKLSREYEINYLKENGYEADFTKLEYSINKGVWGTSVGGKETLCSATNLPDSAYPSQLQKQGEEQLTIEFKCGEVVAVNGEALSGVEAINKLEAIGSAWAIGRDTHVGDTLVGIKGRVGFEAAAPMLIIKSHELLEKHTLTKWQQYWKDQLGTWYGMFMHEAMYSEPVMRDVEAFLDNSQRNVSGKVYITLRPYTFFLVGIESEHDLMNAKFAEYGEKNNAWTADDVKGFTKIYSMPLKIYHAVNDEE